tara:strand:- start:22561 stop:22722 length:162 start_codon:yes stop_codon:yes gene_type:complete
MKSVYKNNTTKVIVLSMMYLGSPKKLARKYGWRQVKLAMKRIEQISEVGYVVI